MLYLNEILGFAAEPELADRLHHVNHHGAVETLNVAPADLGRRRLRMTTDRGTDCAIAIPRDSRLADGAVLYLDQTRAIVVRLGEQAWLRIRPADSAAAVELGYNAGNLHWKVRFEGADLLVARDGPVELYTARLKRLVEGGRVEVIDDD